MYICMCACVWCVHVCVCGHMHMYLCVWRACVWYICMCTGVCVCAQMRMYACVSVCGPLKMFSGQLLNLMSQLNEHFLKEGPPTTLFK